MQTISDRIKERMTTLGIKQVDIVRETHVGKGAVSKWLSGLNTPNGENLTALSRLLQVSADWLLTGNNSASRTQIPVESWDSDTPIDDDEVAIPFYKDFLLACGSGAVGEALNSETRRLRLSLTTLKAAGVEPENAVAMTALGNSNFPDIKDKATVYVDLGFTKIVDGCVYAIDHGGVFKFKYLYNLPKGGVRVVSKNDAEYPEERLTAEEVVEQEFKILGYAFDVQNPLPRRF
ncbi:S24 family peptidase [Aquirhabdus sp.]|uniref:S24 family peptidase n=1 Tax=Aquirhabdus sp. TaxID=2824160 RepID=UPI00396C5D7F